MDYCDILFARYSAPLAVLFSWINSLLNAQSNARAIERDGRAENTLFAQMQLFCVESYLQEEIGYYLNS